MKKNALSLALALALCLSLTIPVLAVENKTTITDDVGYSYTLSQAIVDSYTMERGLHSDKETGTTAKNVTVYQIQEGTVITPVCSEGTVDRNSSLGSGYKLTKEDGLKQAGTVIGADRADRATYFVVVYEEVEADGSGDMHAVKNLVYEYDDNYNEVVTQPLSEGVHLIRREIRWVYAGNSDDPAAVIPPSQGEGCASYLYVEVVSKSQPTDPVQPQQPTAPAVTVEDIPASGTAIASTQTVTVDGKAVEFQMYALADANGNLTNYIKLRDMAYILNGTKAQFAVGYDGTISLTTGQPYEAGGTEMTTPYSGDRAYSGGAQTVKINGKDVAMTAITLTDDNGGGYNYFKLRDLGKALGFNVSWDNGVIVESDKPYTE